MYKKAWIAKNIRRLVDANKGSTDEDKVSSVSALAKKAGLSKPTLTTLVNEPELRNINIDTLIACARVLKVEPWMLMIEDFPFEEVGSNPITKISPDGYVILKEFEKQDETLRYSMMNAASLTLQEVNERSASEIREAAAKYNTTKKS